MREISGPKKPTKFVLCLECGREMELPLNSRRKLHPKCSKERKRKQDAARFGYKYKPKGKTSETIASLLVFDKPRRKPRKSAKPKGKKAEKPSTPAAVRIPPDVKCEYIDLAFKPECRRVAKLILGYSPKQIEFLKLFLELTENIT